MHLRVVETGRSYKARTCMDNSLKGAFTGSIQCKLPREKRILEGTAAKVLDNK